MRRLACASSRSSGVGAFLVMEASGLGGPILGLVLVPGLLAAGVGTLIFIGLDSITGLGTFSLAIPGLPVFSHPTVAMFGWALVIGVVASLVGTAIRLTSLALQALVVPRWLMATLVAGLVLVPAGAMDIGAMSTIMLKLPLAFTLLAVLLFASDGLSVTPLVIVAVVVAYVLCARLPQLPSDLRRQSTGASPVRTPAAEA